MHPAELQKRTVNELLSKNQLHRQIKEHINRPLDINEILSRESDINVAVDTYEFFMRKHHWNLDEIAYNMIIFSFCYQYLIANKDQFLATE